MFRIPQGNLKKELLWGLIMGQGLGLGDEGLGLCRLGFFWGDEDAKDLRAKSGLRYFLGFWRGLRILVFPG